MTPGHPPIDPARLSLQERYAPASLCYGCGPANERGFQIKSFLGDDGVLVAQWTPLPHHHAFADVLNGGVIGTLLDCHCNWAAAHHLMQIQGLDAPPCTVTAEYHIEMRRPTPMAGVVLRASVASTDRQRVVVDGTLSVANSVTATCRGTFVAVKPGHPAYHRW